MRALPLVLLLLVGCKKDDPAPSSDPADPAPEKTPAPAKATEPPPAPPTPAVIDPATFVPIDLSSVKAIADIDAKAPPNAKVTPDRLGFDETEPKGAVIEADGFA